MIKDSGKYPIKDVRGLGLMVGLEFDAECAAGTSGAVTQACLEHGMLMLNTSSYANPLAPINFVFFLVNPKTLMLSSVLSGSVASFLIHADVRLHIPMTHRDNDRYEAVRFIPPLTVTKNEIDLGVDIFTKALDDTFAVSTLRGSGATKMI